MQQQIVLSIRSLCSLSTIVYDTVKILYTRSLCFLPSLVICTVVSQVTLLPSPNSKATVSLLCSLPVPILFQFILIYLNLFWTYLNFVEVFEWKEKWYDKVAWSVLSQQSSSYMQCSIHTRQGFHLGLWPGLWSLCWSQSTTLPSYNGLWSSR